MHISRKTSFWSVSLGHTATDLFMSMGPVLLAFLSGQVLPISNTQIGAAVSAQQMMGAISQPLFGWLADRGGPRWQRILAISGVLWVVGFLLLSVALAMTGQFWLMVVPYAVAALGSGAFHPIGTAIAGEADDGYTASNLSVFFLLGQMGLALGPALAGILLDTANPPGAAEVRVTPIYLLGLLALPIVGFLAIALPGLSAHTEQSEESAALPPTNDTTLPVTSLAILAGVIMLRSLAQPGSVAFIPRLFQQQGWTPAEYGLITSTFWIASGFAGVFFGQLADRYQTRIIVAISLLLSVPSLYLLPVTSGKIAAFGLAVAIGGLTGGSHSLFVTMAQRLIPSSKGLVSGLTLGFIFGTGAISSLIIGNIADNQSLTLAFQIAAGTTGLAGLLALLLPKSHQIHRAGMQKS